MEYVIDEQTFRNFIKQKENQRDETIQWPNSFGHGFSTGQLELLYELKEFSTKAQKGV